VICEEYLCPYPHVTDTVTAYGPASVGVPAITPMFVPSTTPSATPAGNAPLTMDHTGLFAWQDADGLTSTEPPTVIAGRIVVLRWTHHRLTEPGSGDVARRRRGEVRVDERRP